MNEQNRTKISRKRIKTEEAPAGTYAGIARVALEISRRQTADLKRIQEALDAGNDSAALSLMRKFFVVHA